MSLNKATFIGNLGDDARVATVGDKTVANFRIAVNEKRGGEEKTTWVSCGVWGKVADAIGKYLTKGKQVYVEGAVEIEEYTTKDGETRRNLKIAFVNDIKLLGGGKESDSKPKQESKPAADPAEVNPFAR